MAIESVSINAIFSLSNHQRLVDTSFQAKKWAHVKLKVKRIAVCVSTSLLQEITYKWDHTRTWNMQITSQELYQLGQHASQTWHEGTCRKHGGRLMECSCGEGAEGRARGALPP